MKRTEICENGIYMVFEVTEGQQIKLLHFGAVPYREGDIVSEEGVTPFYPVEIAVTGLDHPRPRNGAKYVSMEPGCRLQLRDYKDTRNETGRKLELVMGDEPTGLEVHSHYQFYQGISVVRCWTEVINCGREAVGLEYVSSFALTGIEKEGLLRPEDKMEIRIPRNAWLKELQWTSHTLEELGLSDVQPAGQRHSSQVLGIGNTGNWSAKEYLPMGYLQNRESGASLYWQIEHNGSWYWEISDQAGHLYLKLSGPTEHQSHWWKNLQPGETFVSVPVSVGASVGGFDEAMGELTRYRRAIRRPNADNDRMPVIFNDFMNCLWGDPTTEKELPLIAKAAEAGCEYYCVDCGWYSKGPWWDGVGEWMPSKDRFPGGMKEVMDAVRDSGMIPGLWLELEVMGIKCPKADQVPDDWYFIRHGKRVKDKSRYQLDFRNPAVREHASSVIKRLVEDYGVGYLKMDYNIEPGIGTEYLADSAGDGLLSHNRAYLSWLDGIFEKYPDLVIENCSSGGLRMDYAMLSRYSIQSTSDQEDYKNYATIAANAPSGLTPEQAAVWSYPLEDGDEEEVIFNMINSMLLRIHQSGHLVQLSNSRMELVKEGIACYKEIRQDIKTALPYWPLGTAGFRDSWVSLGLKVDGVDYIAVWRRNSSDDTVSLPVRHLKGREAEAVCIYPKKGNCGVKWNRESGELSVKLPGVVSARLFRVTYF